ncbi:MAG: putative endonuclease [Myxococcota bacterium]|jgi:putative endonuclease
MVPLHVVRRTGHVAATVGIVEGLWCRNGTAGLSLAPVGLRKVNKNRRLQLARSMLLRSPMRRATMSQTERGSIAERRVCRWLRWRGYRVLLRNVRGGGGELDIVALRGGTLHIVEVKARLTDGRWAPRQAVTPQKRCRIVCATQSLLTSQFRPGPNGRMEAVAGLRARGYGGLGFRRVSFDVAEVTRGWPTWTLRVNMLSDAFRADDVVGNGWSGPWNSR